MGNSVLQETLEVGNTQIMNEQILKQECAEDALSSKNEKLINNTVENLVSLSTLKLGQPAIIADYAVQNSYTKRLLCMGLTIGAEIVISKVAPGGETIELTIRGGKISLRRSETSGVMVSVL